MLRGRHNLNRFEVGEVVKLALKVLLSGAKSTLILGRLLGLSRLLERPRAHLIVSIVLRLCCIVCNAASRSCLLFEHQLLFN